MKASSIHKTRANVALDLNSIYCDMDSRAHLAKQGAKQKLTQRRGEREREI